MTKVVVFVCVLLLSACYYDKEEILYAGQDCAPVENPAYTNDIFSLLEKKCNSCHSGAFPSGGVVLDTYSSVLASVNNGSLMGSIRHASGYSPMPKNASKLATCDIETIQRWIDAGAADN